MRRSYKNLAFLALLLGVMLVIMVIDHKEHNGVGKISYRDPKVVLNADETFATFLKDSVATKRALHIVNAPKLIQKMDYPREKFQFIMEPSNVFFSDEELREGMSFYVYQWIVR